MITAIIGKAGTGKSTIARSISSSFDEYVEADALVRKAYNTNVTKSFFYEHDVLLDVLVKGKIDKDKLIKILLSDYKTRRELKDYLFNAYTKPFIHKARLDDTSLLIDGVLPRFSYHFDQVIEVKVPDAIRRLHLAKRGVPEKRIEELFKLQEDM